MELLEKYTGLQQELFNYFGYVEDYRVLPIDDSRIYYWELEGEGPGLVRFASTKEQLADEEAGDYYEN